MVISIASNLFSEAFVAIDGSKFKADNNRDRNYTQDKLKRRLELIDERIGRYLGVCRIKLYI